MFLYIRNIAQVFFPSSYLLFYPELNSLGPVKVHRLVCHLGFNFFFQNCPLMPKLQYHVTQSCF